jgi:hypothetical protein
VSPACPCGLSPAETTLIGASAVSLLVAGSLLMARAIRELLRKRRSRAPPPHEPASATE